jgi:hypothetical protein
MRRASVSPLAARSEPGNAIRIDVERLVNDPIAARPPRWVYRLRPSPIHNAQIVGPPVPFCPTKDWAVDRRQSLEIATRRAPDEKGTFYAVGMCTASSFS